MPPVHPVPVPSNGHQRHDEVSLVELDAFGVDSNKDVGNLLLIGARIQLDDLEAEIAEVMRPVDSFLELVSSSRDMVTPRPCSSASRKLRTVDF